MPHPLITQTRKVAPLRGATLRVWVIYSAQVLSFG
jgi:hypothetical protein